MVVGLVVLDCVLKDATVEISSSEPGNLGDGSGLLRVGGIFAAIDPLTSCDILSVHRVAGPAIGTGVGDCV